MYGRHYSCKRKGLPPPSARRFGPGRSVCLLTDYNHAGLVWLFSQYGAYTANKAYCLFFRNENGNEIGLLSSAALLAAEYYVKDWEHDGFITFVNGTAVKGNGLCFRKAGWKETGRTKEGLMILEKTNGKRK